MSIHQITPRIGIVVAVRLAYVQVTRADAYAAAGNVVRLEDGSSTKRYNGRLRAIDQQISRGMIYDRKRIPIATSNWQELQRIRRTYEAMGIDIDKSCSLRDSLHYPLGVAAFHLVSDVRTLYRWRARNAHFEIGRAHV